MAGGRHSQPLFDLIRNRGNVNTPQDRRTTMNPGVGWRPGMAPGSEPPPPPDGTPGDQAANAPLKYTTPAATGANTPARDGDLSEATGIGRWINGGGLGGGTVRVPVNAVYVAVTALIIVAVAAFAIGSVLSKRAAERDASQDRPQPSITEPIETPEPVAPEGTLAERSPTPSKATPTKPEPAKTTGNLQESTSAGPRPGNALCLTSSGWTTVDQREESLNYLHLAYVSQTEAEDAISFLAQNGLDTFALYVDPQQVRGNNFSPTRPFKLYASKGITSDEYSKKMTAKTNVEAAVARLGPRWQKERKGSSNFSKPAWEKK